MLKISFSHDKAHIIELIPIKDDLHIRVRFKGSFQLTGKSALIGHVRFAKEQC